MTWTLYHTYKDYSHKSGLERVENEADKLKRNNYCKETKIIPEVSATGTKYLLYISDPSDDDITKDRKQSKSTQPKRKKCRCK